MTFTEKLLKKIIKGAGLGNKKGKSSPQSPTFSKQNYTPLKHKPAAQPSMAKKSLKKTASLFSGQERPEALSGHLRKNGYRAVVFVLCLFVLGFGIFLYGGGGWIKGGLSKIGYFEIGDNVVIEGCHVTNPAEIKELAEIRYHTNLFSINPAKVAAILDKHPWVRDAKIHLDWPNKLVINIVEHVPEALAVLGAAGHHQLYYMDADGTPFIAVKPGQDLDYPVITGMEGIKSSDKRREALHEAMQFIRLVKRNNPNLPAQSISEIHLDPTEGMVVYLVEYPFPIYFGRGDVVKKYRRLEHVLAVLYRQRKHGLLISQVKYIQMDYSENKVLVAQIGSS